MNTFTPIPVFGLTYANRLEAIYQHKAAAYEGLMQREQTAAESAALMETCTADWYWLAKTVGADWQADVETARLPVELDAERHVAAWNALTAEAARAFASLESTVTACEHRAPYSEGCAECFAAEAEAQLERRAEFDALTAEAAPAPCAACGGKGYVVTRWEDAGSAENGPKAVPADGHFCTCARGTELEREDAAMAADYEAAELAYEARRDGTAEDDGADLELQPCVRCGQAIEAGPVNVCEPCANGAPPVDEPERDASNYATEAEYYGGLLAESLAPAGAPLTALEANGLFASPILDEVTYGGATVPAIVERALPDVLAAAERLCDDVIAGISPELQAVYERPVPAGFREARRAALGLEAIGTGRCVHGYASTVDGGSEWCAACRLERAGIAVVELPPVLIPASEVFQGADAAEFGERVDESTPRQHKPAAHPIVAWLSEEARRVGSDLREQMTRLGY